MKTYVFKLVDSRGNAYHYAAEAPNQSEAAQAVCAVVGGHSFCTMRERTKEYDTRCKAGSAAAVVNFVN